MRSSKSCGHPIIGTGGCCIRCATRVHQSTLTYRKAQVKVLERVTAQLKASLEPEPDKLYSIFERTQSGWYHKCNEPNCVQGIRPYRR